MRQSEALAAYEAARPRLPAAGAGGACAPVPDLAALASRFDVFLLDAFGVLNIGETAIPGAVGRVADLRAAGKRVLVLTNAASTPADGLVAKFARLGYDFAACEIVSSREALVRAVAAEPPRRWGVMIPEGAALPDLAGIDVVPLADDPEPYGAADGILLLGSGDWSEARQTRLETALADRPRPVLVGNPDIVAPREAGFTREPGHYAHRLADRTGIRPRFFGKPFPEVFAIALGRAGPAEPRRAVMVGDSLHTDILGAQAAGIASALVTGYGFLAGTDAAEAIGTTGIRPDFVLERP